jgi:prepilin-type N-terminal cleavage/methylation domain-containing protein
MKSPKAFTLIELLIVVAIIAILAAIAVPNFLEAQVRSKVSRTKADMRSITVAIEAYKIDTNRYPTMRLPRPTPGDTSSNETLGFELSTPISYLSSMEITRDVFKTQRANLPLGRERYNYRNYEFLKQINAAFANPNDPAGRRANADGAYRLVSAGPDTFHFWDGGSPRQDYQNFQVIPYDPTNGTVSIGDIFRTQVVGDGARPDPLP